MSIRSGVVLALSAAAIGAAGFLAYKGFLKLDPLGAPATTPDETLGIRLDGVSFKQFHKDKLVASANVDHVDVRKDRQLFDFFGISGGQVLNSEGQKYQFSSDQASYDSVNELLSVLSGANVKSKDMDLKTAALTIDRKAGTLRAPGNVAGAFMNGQVTAQNLLFDINNKSYEVQKTKWVGSLPKKTMQELGQDPSGPTRWDIEGGLKGNSKFDTYTNASATDGEILVKAPVIKREKATDILTATGTVYYFSEKANLVCDQAVIYRKEKRAVLTGNVHMLVKPKDQEKLEMSVIEPFHPAVPEKVFSARPKPTSDPETQQQKDLEEELHSSKTVRKYPLHVSAAKIEYWYAKGSRHAVITGEPQAFQELGDPGVWRRVSAFKGLYDGEKERLRLESASGKKDARMWNSNNDDLVGDWFDVSTKEDDDDYEAGYVTGRVYRKKDPDLEIGKGNGGTTGSNGGAPPPVQTTTGGGGGTPPKTTGG